MMSFIIVGSSDETKSQALTACEEKKIDQFDINLITSDKESVGIGIIKKVQEKTFLKPLRSSDKAIIIPDAQSLTIPAQNALLKLLEEPPNHTYLFLLTTSLESLLPTIQSRCQILKKMGMTTRLTDDEQAISKTNYSEWTKRDIGLSLKLAEQSAKDKDKALQTLQNMTIFARSQMLATIADNGEALTLARHLRELQTASKLLTSTNTSPRLALEHLLLNLN